MTKWLHKMRLVLAVMALGLSCHYVILAGHLACEVHQNCDEDSGQLFGASSSDEHEHCLVEIAPSRVHDTSIQDAHDAVFSDYSFARILPIAPHIVKASRTPNPLMVRARADYQFIQSVRIIT